MKTFLTAAAFATIALTTTAAHAGERKLFGPPSEPTIWGHQVVPSKPRIETNEVRLERQAPSASERVRKSSDRRSRSEARGN